MNNKRLFISFLLVNMVITSGMLLFYHIFILKPDTIDSKIVNRSIRAAENEILFSDRFEKLMKTAVPSDFINAASISRKAVVFVQAKGDRIQNAFGSPFSSSSGSGVIISADGYIVTNHHVIKDASKIEITLNDNRVFEASVVGSDPNTDIALLKIVAQNLDFLIFSNSDSLMIGEWVMAVGNPFRLQSTVTAGIVSAKARNINLLENQGIESFIQTDAAVNPGNSGGALINTKGDLVGICTAIQSNSGQYEGFSFAVPSNLARKVVADLREFGVVQRGWLGVEIENVTNQSARSLNLNEVKGVLIASVAHNSGASEAGIKVNDVVVKVNQTEVSSTSELMEQIGNYRPGDAVSLTIIRNGNKIEKEITLRNQLNSTDLIGTLSDGIFEELGVEVRDADKYEKAVFAPSGVIVVSVKNRSIIGATRMEPGYIIIKVNNQPVTTAYQLRQLLESLRGKVVVMDGYYQNLPGEYPYTFTIP
ncbi:MAG: trypsin-like peptidase domain-containing protein [Chitinophagales bacterium]|nr:trypsin-like peptidase domain-containing protein [Chitinophagales bacterium]